MDEMNLNVSKEIKNIYSLFEDDLSKDTLMARLQAEIEGKNERIELKLENCFDELAASEKANQRDVREHEYFKFPERFRKGTALIDCGSFDGRDGLYFSKWCGGDYSKIYAFEPIPESAEVCKRKLSEERAIVYQMALSDENGVDYICSESQWKSYLLSDAGEFGRRENDLIINKQEIKVATIDEIIKDDIGFIKLQAMGREYQVLRGAENVISTYKPMLSIVVNCASEIVTIMSYLHSLVPNYIFYLRQYYDSTTKKAGRCVLVCSIEE